MYLSLFFIKYYAPTYSHACFAQSNGRFKTMKQVVLNEKLPECTDNKRIIYTNAHAYARIGRLIFQYYRILFGASVD